MAEKSEEEGTEATNPMDGQSLLNLLRREKSTDDNGAVMMTLHCVRILTLERFNTNTFIHFETRAGNIAKCS